MWKSLEYTQWHLRTELILHLKAAQYNSEYIHSSNETVTSGIVLVNTFVLKFGWNVFVLAISMFGEHITHNDAVDSYMVNLW